MKPIGGATVTLYDGTTPVGDPFTTLADGAYSFSGLSIGKTYTVCQTSLKTNWTRTVPVATTAGTVDCPDTTRGYSVTPVGTVSGLNFGNVQTASIQGRRSSSTPTRMAHRTPVKAFLHRP